MIRLSVDTKHTPQQVIERALKFFGERGLKLDEERLTEDTAVFTGGGGYVTVAATGREGQKTEVILETREWEYDVRKFMEAIA